MPLMLVIQIIILLININNKQLKVENICILTILVNFLRIPLIIH